ncbi:MAG: hypothetical protein HY791_00615 [Deltaproteobacteria bacterium]|nr:hypothetical protein [Deltaproteobacteria bacterium]
MEAGVERLASNPFYVLGIPITATSMEIEREAQRILAMLELGLAAAKSYETPLGARERSKDLVREAMAELRDPRKRLIHELRARLPASAIVDLEEPIEEPDELTAPWPQALRALGFES